MILSNRVLGPFFFFLFSSFVSDYKSVMMKYHWWWLLMIKVANECRWFLNKQDHIQIKRVLITVGGREGEGIRRRRGFVSVAFVSNSLLSHVYHIQNRTRPLYKFTWHFERSIETHTQNVDTDDRRHLRKWFKKRKSSSSVWTRGKQVGEEGGGRKRNKSKTILQYTRDWKREKKKRKKKQLLTAGNKVHCLVFVLINYFSFFKFGKKNLLFASLTSLFLNCILFSKSRLSVTHPGK